MLRAIFAALLVVLAALPLHAQTAGAARSISVTTATTTQYTPWLTTPGAMRNTCLWDITANTGAGNLDLEIQICPTYGPGSGSAECAEGVAGTAVTVTSFTAQTGTGAKYASMGITSWGTGMSTGALVAQGPAAGQWRARVTHTSSQSGTYTLSCWGG